jgi:hypothetical protein
MIRVKLLQLMKMEMATRLGTGHRGGLFWAFGHPLCKWGPETDVRLRIYQREIGAEEWAGKFYCSYFVFFIFERLRAKTKR